MENDLNFCRRQALNFARRAVYSRDQKTRKALADDGTAMGGACPRRGRGLSPLSAEFRLAAEIS